MFSDLNSKNIRVEAVEAKAGSFLESIFLILVHAKSLLEYHMPLSLPVLVMGLTLSSCSWVHLYAPSHFEDPKKNWRLGLLYLAACQKVHRMRGKMGSHLFW